MHLTERMGGCHLISKTHDSIKHRKIQVYNILRTQNKRIELYTVLSLSTLSLYIFKYSNQLLLRFTVLSLVKVRVLCI